MKPRSSVRRRGQPLLALILLMVSWVGARAAMWEAPEVSRTGRIEAAIAGKAHQSGTSSAGTSERGQGQTPGKPDRTRVITPPPAVLPSVAAPAIEAIAEPSGEPTAPALVPSEPQSGPGEPVAQAAPSPGKPVSVQTAGNHQLLYSEGMSMPMIDDGEAMAEVAPRRPAAMAASAAAAQAAPSAGPRWSGDAWLLLRQGGNSFNAPGAGLPGVVVPAGFYGGSQMGAVLRYRLDRGSALRPALYLRYSSGLEWPRGEELAAGIMFRPLGQMPVAVMLEGRATQTLSGTVVRPAAALVSELPPAHLPLGLRGEAYVQAGVVGGRQGTAFVDGQARVERPFIRTGKFELRAGGGAWGGAQKGASRLDVGPTATLAVPIGPAGARLSADYRIRVAGRAAPGSGAVLTLSAGF